MNPVGYSKRSLADKLGIKPGMRLAVINAPEGYPLPAGVKRVDPPAKPLDQAANSADIPESWQDGTPQTTASIDMKKAVKNIQLILNKNGYEAGGADGVMGQKTKDAIIAFQTDNKMKATGEIDADLVKALLARK